MILRNIFSHYLNQRLDVIIKNVSQIYEKSNNDQLIDNVKKKNHLTKNLKNDHLINNSKTDINELINCETDYVKELSTPNQNNNSRQPRTTTVDNPECKRLKIKTVTQLGKTIINQLNSPSYLTFSTTIMGIPWSTINPVCGCSALSLHSITTKRTFQIKTNKTVCQIYKFLIHEHLLNYSCSYQQLRQIRWGQEPGGEQ